jgi:hypothetical protein
MNLAFELWQNIQASGHYRSRKMAKNGQNESKTTKMTVFGHFADSVASDCRYILAWFNLQNCSSHPGLQLGRFRFLKKKDHRSSCKNRVSAVETQMRHSKPV